MSAEHLSEAFLAALERRRFRANSWNRALPNVRPSRLRRIRWTATALYRRRLGERMLKYGSDRSFQGRLATLEQEWRRQSGIRSASIPWALNDVVTGFWAGGELSVPKSAIRR
jgi:ATP-binding cassette subfamily C (CFTR/MRP) protein 1